MLGSAVARRAAAAGYAVQAMVRANSDRRSLAGLPITYVEADLEEPETLAGAFSQADLVVHTAAQVGDWGPVEKYRAVNVVALEHMLADAERHGRLKLWVHISTVGVYTPGHHYGTDESAPRSVQGLDGYTQTKAEAEVVLQQHVQEHGLPAVVLRPGFLYGPGERHGLKRMVEKLQAGKMKFIGPGDKLFHNTYVDNLVDAIFLALEKPGIEGQTYNILDARLVTRQEFIHTMADYLGKPHPGHVPERLARVLVRPIERIARLRGRVTTPPLTSNMIRYMTYNLDFSIEKARRELGYQPRVDFREGIRVALDDMVNEA